MPDLVKDVLGSLKGDIRDIEGNSALDILHYAIGKIMNLFAGDELKYFFGLLGCVRRWAGLWEMLRFEDSIRIWELLVSLMVCIGYVG